MKLFYPTLSLLAVFRGIFSGSALAGSALCH